MLRASAAAAASLAAPREDGDDDSDEEVRWEADDSEGRDAWDDLLRCYRQGVAERLAEQRDKRSPEGGGGIGIGAAAIGGGVGSGADDGFFSSQATHATQPDVGMALPPTPPVRRPLNTAAEAVAAAAAAASAAARRASTATTHASPQQRTPPHGSRGSRPTQASSADDFLEFFPEWDEAARAVPATPPSQQPSQPPAPPAAADLPPPPPQRKRLRVEEARRAAFEERRVPRLDIVVDDDYAGGRRGQRHRASAEAGGGAKAAAAAAHEQIDACDDVIAPGGEAEWEAAKRRRLSSTLRKLDDMEGNLQVPAGGGGGQHQQQQQQRRGQHPQKPPAADTARKGTCEVIEEFDDAPQARGGSALQEARAARLQDKLRQHALRERNLERLAIIAIDGNPMGNALVFRGGPKLLLETGRSAAAGGGAAAVPGGGGIDAIEPAPFEDVPQSQRRAAALLRLDALATAAPAAGQGADGGGGGGGEAAAAQRQTPLASLLSHEVEVMARRFKVYHGAGGGAKGALASLLSLVLKRVSQQHTLRLGCVRREVAALQRRIAGGGGGGILGVTREEVRRVLCSAPPGGGGMAAVAAAETTSFGGGDDLGGGSSSGLQPPPVQQPLCLVLERDVATLRPPQRRTVRCRGGRHLLLSTHQVAALSALRCGDELVVFPPYSVRALGGGRSAVLGADIVEPFYLSARGGDGGVTASGNGVSDNTPDEYYFRASGEASAAAADPKEMMRRSLALDGSGGGVTPPRDVMEMLRGAAGRCGVAAPPLVVQEWEVVENDEWELREGLWGKIENMIADQ